MAATNQPERRYGVRHTRNRVSEETLAVSFIVSLFLIVFIFFVIWGLNALFPREGAVPVVIWPDAVPALRIPVKEQRITTFVLKNDVDALRTHIARAAVRHGGQILEQYDHERNNRLRVVLSESQASYLNEAISTTKRDIRYGSVGDMPYVQWAETGYLPAASENEPLVTAEVITWTPEFSRGWVTIMMVTLFLGILVGGHFMCFLYPNFVEARRYRRDPSPS